MYQKITLVGNLGSDPEMRYMADGTAVTNFSIATNRQYSNRSSGEIVKETTWFRISVWGRQAEACHQYLTRGSSALVEGRLIADASTGGPKTFQRRDGTTGASFEVNADTVKFMGNNSGSDQDSEYNQDVQSKPASNQKAIEEDEIPF